LLQGQLRVGCSREWAVCHSTRKAPSIIINITTGVHLLVVLLLLEILCSQLPVKDVVLLQVLIPLSCSITMEQPAIVLALIDLETPASSNTIGSTLVLGQV
jgi:hypothetical protein